MDLELQELERQDHDLQDQEPELPSNRPRPARKRRGWILCLLLLSTAYMASYCLLSRSGVLSPGRRAPDESSEGHFVVLQNKSLVVGELFQRQEIDPPEIDLMGPPAGLAAHGGDPAYLFRETLLTRAYRPAGYLHQVLADHELWPASLSPAYRVGGFPAGFPGTGASGMGAIDPELQRGIDEMNRFLQQ